ncbi:fasciclin domain-containing protein [Actinoplanes sp. CA-252034]|uniref:fasciclin domain-containing protein n=1 Tax=Actinoplanes sp. CA-252034 TaxID=3239906 RepID=UPI003D974A25
MKRVLLAAVLTATLSGCALGQGGVVTGQPLPSGAAPADACAPQNLAAMAGKPVSVAIAANPGLSGMAAGLDRAGLRALDDTPALTLFATSDRFLATFPFQRIPTLWDDPEELARTLKQAAIAERLDPGRLPGTHTTMSGTRAVVTTDAGDLRVNDTKTVCHQLDTANAAVYIVDELVPLR